MTHPTSAQEPSEQRAATPLAYSVQTLRNASGLGRSTIHEAIASGALKARKLGAKLVILHDDAKAWLDAMPERRPTKAPYR